MLGTDVVMTGYIDTVNSQLAADERTITVSGRSKCADLVDYSAGWPGMQITNSNLVQIAQQLVRPYEGPAGGKRSHRPADIARASKRFQRLTNSGV